MGVQLRQALDRESRLESQKRAAEEAAERAEEEASALRKALEIHVDDFQARTGAQIEAQLLYNIAKVPPELALFFWSNSRHMNSGTCVRLSCCRGFCWIY